jgi:hypothetical protein
MDTRLLTVVVGRGTGTVLLFLLLPMMIDIMTEALRTYLHLTLTGTSVLAESKFTTTHHRYDYKYDITPGSEKLRAN